MQTAIVVGARGVIGEDSPRKLVVGITGITGTVGKRLAELLQADGCTVVGLVQDEGAREAPSSLSYRPVYGNVTDWRAVKEFVTGLDVVVHLAEDVGDGQKKLCRAINIQGVLNICEVIMTVNPSCRLINCSSVAALRISRLAPFIGSVYARSKAKADRIVKEYRVTRGLRVATVYPGLVYGSGDARFLPSVMGSLRKGGFFSVTGGEKNAPVVSLDDLCELFRLAALNQYSSENNYLGAGGASMGIHRFFERIADRIGVTAPKWTLKKNS